MHNKSIRPYTIEKANLRDLFALSALEKVCFEKDAWPLIELMGVLSFPGVVRLRAVVNEKMAGFIAGEGRFNDQTGWILTLGVLPEYRRMGIAKALLAECERRLKMPTVKLTVRCSNLSAIRLYEGLDYQRVDRLPRYYLDKEDGLVFAKTIEREP